MYIHINKKIKDIDDLLLSQAITKLHLLLPIAIAWNWLN